MSMCKINKLLVLRTIDNSLLVVSMLHGLEVSLIFIKKTNSLCLGKKIIGFCCVHACMNLFWQLSEFTFTLEIPMNKLCK